MKTTAFAVIAGLLSFLIGCVWVFVRAEMFVQYFYAASMVGLTHTFTLGWVSLMIVGVLRPGGELIYNPQGDMVLEPESVLIALGQRRQLEQLEKLAGQSEELPAQNPTSRGG